LRWLLVCVCLLACSKNASKKPLTEQRVVTAGVSLLALLPPGADAIAEINVARLRGNSTFGSTVRALSPWLKAQVAEAAPPVDLALDADLMAAAVYQLGTLESQLIVLVRGKGIDADRLAAASPLVRALDANTLVFGPPELTGKAGDFAENGGAIGDEALRAVYDEAMPFRAPGASLRLGARLSTEARIAAAARLGYEGALPATISVWFDVSDDLALIARMRADDEPGAQHLAADTESQSKRIARLLRQTQLLRKLRVVPKGEDVWVIWTVGPKALAKALGREDS
jgi:hypothetical protein